MKCNKYKLKNGLEFLGYANDNEELSFPPFWEEELLAEDIDPGKEENANYQIVHAVESWSVRRTRDKILEDEHILNYIDLANAYFLIKAKSLNKSRAVREAVIQKYIEVLQFIKLEDNGSTNGPEIQSS